nr:hypothetical protein [Tanacetum cinerariifolium]GEW91559.1 hypothetical protein [Tanacetum cinerariifolium]
MDGWKPKNLKNKSFADIQDLFNKAMKKRAADELEQEIAKKQRIEDENESVELKRCLKIVPDDGDDMTIDATPLSSKSPTIVDYKIYKEGRKRFFQIIQADGNSQMYLIFCKMLKNFNKEDLETMFEHHVEDNIWKNEQGLVKVEKMYPLKENTLQQMCNDARLQVDYEVEMAYDLLRLVRKQLREGYVAE